VCNSSSPKAAERLDGLDVGDETVAEERAEGEETRIE